MTAFVDVAIQLSFRAIPVPVLIIARRQPMRTPGAIHRRRRRIGRDIRQLGWWAIDDDFAGYHRPRNLLECLAEGIGTRLPCPWYSCRYHLGLDDGSGVLKLRIDPDDLENHETCAMAVANRYEERGLQVGEVAELMNLSEGSIEAVERVAKWKLSTMLGGNFKDWE